MVNEATHTAEAVYNLRTAVGKGHRLWCGYLELDDGETIDTGLDTIEAALFQFVGNVAATYHLVSPAEVATTGTLTMSVGAIADYTDDGDQKFFAMVVGTARGL